MRYWNLKAWKKIIPGFYEKTIINDLESLVVEVVGHVNQ